MGRCLKGGAALHRRSRQGIVPSILFTRLTATACPAADED